MIFMCMYMCVYGSRVFKFVPGLQEETKGESGCPFITSWFLPFRQYCSLNMELHRQSESAHILPMSTLLSTTSAGITDMSGIAQLYKVCLDFKLYLPLEQQTSFGPESSPTPLLEISIPQFTHVYKHQHINFFEH